jgi:hypothetical protein
LNATDDRHLFHTKRSAQDLPVLEGKHIDPFTSRLDAVSRFVSRADARAKLPAAPFERPRLAYRDVASATNERTLIAAVVPAGTITTHTLFCCRTALDDWQREALCALFNSFPGNWLARRWVSTHLTAALVERLPVPRPSDVMLRAGAIADLARGLAASGPLRPVGTEARMHALAARAWQLTRDDLMLVLDDFPLVDPELKQATVAAFDGLPGTGRGMRPW